MQKPYFFVRFSNRTFEHYSGIGYQDAGGRPEKFVPLNEADFGLHLTTADYIRDANGDVTGCVFKNCEDGSLHEVFPGKVYTINVWTTAVDDDGCPEDICINFYVELVPYSE